MRLDKYLCDAGYGTRSEIKKLIKEKIVYVNDELVTKADFKVNEDKDIVFVGDEQVEYKKFVYYMLYKPSGYISATEGNVPLVVDLVPSTYKGLFPVGRLDKDTEGLLLITNDGQLAHDLLAPKKHVDKEYYVECRNKLTEEMINHFESGMELLDGTTFAKADCINIQDYSCHLILHEGKYHEIKRMFEAEGNLVTYLKRIRMKNLLLDENLKKGEYRELTEEELNNLKKDV